MMQQDEPNNFNNAGCINQIVLGYFTLALREMGMDQKAIRKAQKLMNGLLDSTDAETAQKAYPNPKNHFCKGDQI